MRRKKSKKPRGSQEIIYSSPPELAPVYVFNSCYLSNLFYTVGSLETLTDLSGNLFHYFTSFTIEKLFPLTNLAVIWEVFLVISPPDRTNHSFPFAKVFLIDKVLFKWDFRKICLNGSGSFLASVCFMLSNTSMYYLK